MTDFSIPRRMSPAAFIIIFLKSLRDFIGVSFIAIIYLLVDIYNSSTIDLGEVAFAVVFTVALPAVIAFIRYYFSKYHIENNNLIFTHGFGFKQTTSIPLSKVHTLRTKRGIVYRLTEMRGVTFDTLASSTQEVELILDESEWQGLQQSVRADEDFAASADTAPPPFRNDTLIISNLNIIKGALCQNHLKGFAILAAVLLAVLDNLSQLKEGVSRQVIDYIDTQANNLAPSATDWILIAAVAYLFAMLLWIGKVALRYYGMSIQIADKRLTIESGLLSRRTCRITRDKATILSIKQNPIEKIANCQTIGIRQAENVSDPKKEETGIRIYGSDLGDRLLAWWLDDNSNADSTPLLSAKAGKGLLMRRCLPHLLVAVMALVIMVFAADIMIPAVIICTVYAVLTTIRAMMAWRHGGIELTETYIRIDCGNIALIREYIRYQNVESVSIRNTPFTSVTDRVSIQISTNAGSSRVYSLKSDTAHAIRNIITYKTP